MDTFLMIAADSGSGERRDNWVILETKRERVKRMAERHAQSCRQREGDTTQLRESAQPKRRGKRVEVKRGRWWAAWTHRRMPCCVRATSTPARTSTSHSETSASHVATRAAQKARSSEGLTW